MLNQKSICQTEFGELCHYVQSQLTPSGSRELDRKTLAFGIYWQICNLLDIEVVLPSRADAGDHVYTAHLDELLHERTDGSFDGRSTAEDCIESKLNDIYGNADETEERVQISTYA